MSDRIQSVLFDKKRFSPERAKQWLSNHKLHPIKDMHETKDKYRFRIKEPDEDNFYYRTKKIDHGIEIIVMFPESKFMKRNNKT